jgi:hypothetical protein
MSLKQIKIFNGTNHVANVPNHCVAIPTSVPKEVWKKVQQFARLQQKSFQYGSWFFTKDWM